ncbi:MAG: hypothetical protein K6T57_13635 [Thermaceae bacterium]|nr:hypothetical protein [Thermaceae bacterium]
MNLFHRDKHPPDEAEQLRAKNAELEAQVQQLQEDLEFYRKQNERIVHDASPAISENAVLRYELYKCQSDRKILEFHISGARAEARAALNLLGQLAPAHVPQGQILLEAVLFLIHEVRGLGLDSGSLPPLEKEAQEAWTQTQGAPWHFSPERWLALRVGGVLRAIELEREHSVQAADRPADGLGAFDAALGRCGDLLRQWLETLAHTDSAAGESNPTA